MSEDFYSIKTNLRPNYFERFPFYAPQEMAIRLGTMTFEHATLLNLRNIRTTVDILGSQEPYERYLHQSIPYQERALREVLQQRGIAAHVAGVVSSDRHHFLSEHHQATASLDRSHHVHDDTYLPSPSLVALMLEMSMRIPAAGVITEIGIGTGFHAQCLAQLWEGSSFLGVDRNPVARALCKEQLRQTGLAERFTVLDEHHTTKAIASAGFIYATAALSIEQLELLCLAGVPGSMWLVPRQLTFEEFESEPARSWLRRTCGSYTGYQTGSWQQYVAVELFQLGTGFMRHKMEAMYGVRSISYSEEPQALG